jgi:hypothetical protein
MTPAAREWSVDDATKAFAATLGLAYALGLVCINGYLLHLGASDFSLFRPRFVLTGSWCLMTFAFIATFQIFGIATFVWNINPQLSRVIAGLLLGSTRERNKGDRLWALIACVLAFTVPTLGLSIAVGWSSVLWLNFAVLALAGTMALTYWALSRRLSSVQRVLLLILYTAVVLAGLFIYITVFVTRVLPILPEQVGGTKPYPVEVVMLRDDARLLSHLGLDIDTSTGVTRDCEMMFSGDTFIVLRNGDTDETFVIDRDAVIATHPVD